MAGYVCAFSAAACSPFWPKMDRGAAVKILWPSLSQLGQQYGSEMADRGVLLKDTLEAFIFFRTMVLDSANTKSWGRIIEMADRVMVGVAESYQDRKG